MHRKSVFSLAAVFLLVALIVPPVLVILQTDNTIYKYIIPTNSPVQGATNITITITPPRTHKLQHSNPCRSNNRSSIHNPIHPNSILGHKPHSSGASKNKNTWLQNGQLKQIKTILLSHFPTNHKRLTHIAVKLRFPYFILLPSDSVLSLQNNRKKPSGRWSPYLIIGVTVSSRKMISKQFQNYLKPQIF